MRLTFRTRLIGRGIYRGADCSRLEDIIGSINELTTSPHHPYRTDEPLARYGNFVKMIASRVGVSALRQGKFHPYLVQIWNIHTLSTGCDITKPPARTSYRVKQLGPSLGWRDVRIKYPAEILLSCYSFKSTQMTNVLYFQSQRNPMPPSSPKTCLAWPWACKPGQSRHTKNTACIYNLPTDMPAALSEPCPPPS